MNIKRDGNATTVTISTELEILYSYNIPVAGWVYGKGYFKSNQFYSVTTSRHINHYTRGAAVRVGQDWIYDLLGTITFEVPGGIGCKGPWEVTR